MYTAQNNTCTMTTVIYMYHHNTQQSKVPYTYRIQNENATTNYINASADPCLFSTKNRNNLNIKI